MTLIKFKDLPDTTTPLNSNNLNFNFNEILNLVYPIGRGFIDFTNTNFSDYLGFKWERELIGLTPIGFNEDDSDFNEVGKMGGEKSHKLTLEEMPSHTHGQLFGNMPMVDENGTSNSVTGYRVQYRDGQNMPQIITENSGGNKEFNLITPYKVVAYWKRVE